MMNIKILQVTFYNEFHKLDRYYHKRLWKNPWTRELLEVHKKDLLANLFEEWVKLRDRSTEDCFDPAKLLFVKAKDVWIDFIRLLIRDAKRNRYESIESISENYFIDSCMENMESRDTVALIKKFLEPSDFDLLQYRAEGYTYKQILEVAKYASEDAAKTRYYRVKNLVRQHFRFPNF